jgi:phosphatidylglycerol:prolipoprotein diacylglycerol transferase
MDSQAIYFPGLDLTFNPPKVAFNVFGHDIRWYGVIIAFGFLLAVIYVLKRCAQFGYTADDLLDMLIVSLPVGLVCARAYYVVFNYDLYRDNFWDVFKVWNGGLAIYGGVIGGLGCAAIMSRIKKIKPTAILDLGSLGFLIGQSIGRWANFINREAYGSETTLPWRMEIFDFDVQARISVHPCFLYESLWNALGFLILHKVSKKRRFDGEIFLLYLVWYGFGRGFIEGLRTDSLYFFSTGLRISQVIAFSSCILAALVLAYILFDRKPDPANLQVNRMKQREIAERTEENERKRLEKEENKRRRTK